MPRLVIRKGEGTGTDHALSGACVVGRHASAQFVLGDPLVSRNHFRVTQEDGAWMVYDLGSRNGTVVNGEPISSSGLSDGDRIVVGTTELEFVQKDMLAVGARPGAAAARPVVPPPAARPVIPPPAAKPVIPPPAAKPVIPPPAAKPVIPPPAAKPVVPPPAARPVIPPPAARPAVPPSAPKPAVHAPIPSKKRR